MNSALICLCYVSTCVCAQLCDNKQITIVTAWLHLCITAGLGLGQNGLKHRHIVLTRAVDHLHDLSHRRQMNSRVETRRRARVLRVFHCVGGCCCRGFQVVRVIFLGLKSGLVWSITAALPADA